MWSGSNLLWMYLKLHFIFSPSFQYIAHKVFVSINSLSLDLLGKKQWVLVTMMSTEDRVASDWLVCIVHWLTGRDWGAFETCGEHGRSKPNTHRLKHHSWWLPSGLKYETCDSIPTVFNCYIMVLSYLRPYRLGSLITKSIELSVFNRPTTNAVRYWSWSVHLSKWVGDYKEMVASMAISVNARVNLSKIPELCKLNYLWGWFIFNLYCMKLYYNMAAQVLICGSPG